MATTKDAPNLQLDFVEIVAPRLWMSTTYKNTYVGNAAPALALNVTSPLTGWYDCGTISAARVPVTKEMRELKRGIPKTSRKFWEIDRTAQITFSTSDLSPYVEALVMGQTIRNTLIGNACVAGSLVGSAARTKVGLDATPSPTSLVQYDVVVCASPKVASLESSFNLAVIESNTGTFDSTLVLEGAGFPISIALEDKIKKVTRTAFIDRMGTDTIRSAMLFWDTKLSGTGAVKIQHVLYFPKVRNFTGGDMDFKDAAEEYETAITLAAQAVEMTFDDASTGYDFYKKWMLSY